MTRDYDDIINLERPISNYPCMSVENRAMQFHPFAALNGFEEAIEGVSSVVDENFELDEFTRNKLENTLIFLSKNIQKLPFIFLKYFKLDFIKERSGCLKRIDCVYQVIEFQDGEKITFSDIRDIEFLYFKSNDSKLE